MILSHSDIEDIAAAVTWDFDRFFFGADDREKRQYVQPTPIDQLAKEYLKLNVTFANLSQDGSILGLTTYADTQFEIIQNGYSRILPLKRNQIVLDSSFIQPGNVRRMCGRRRFTLAHECAHQILFQLEKDESKLAHRRAYAERRVHTTRTLKTHEDWNEWQANALGAAILMPRAEVERAMWSLTLHQPLTSYGGYLFGDDQFLLKEFCSTFGVSKTAASIRLEHLGYLERRSIWEYQDPLEVVM
ncbi:MAG: ImmA/IrrE family metallo-endopeptidase [Clostridiales bacterium]|nr:ImmA/IrrE family metallo-endopeptidase [Clostridiales bacterium]